MQKYIFQFILALLLPISATHNHYFHILPLLPQKNCLQGADCGSEDILNFKCEDLQAIMPANLTYTYLTSEPPITWYYDKDSNLFYPKEEYE